MRHLILSFALLLATAASAAEPPHLAQKPNLTILADESLMLPLAHIARAYADNDKTPLTIILKNATEAENQIEQGLEAHVMLTENHPLVERLAAQGLTDVSSTRAFARTQLALVTTNEMSKQFVAKRISFAATIYTTPGLPVFINAPGTAEGARAKLLLKGYEFSEALSSRAQVETSHEEILEAVRDGQGLGLILAADAVAQPDIAVLSLLPAEVSAPVTYEAVVLASESMGDAKGFTTFLASRQAQDILAHYGFQPPN
ncbi:MAG: substrate-binding domain-containing protein [Pseudomonadota bacterium]